MMQPDTHLRPFNEEEAPDYGEGTSCAKKGSSSKSLEVDFDKCYNEFYQEEDEDSDDSDFVDSDFEVEEGDDDLFRDNVDTEVNDNNEQVQVQDLEDDDALEDADLNLRKEHHDKLQYKFGTFNPQVDMDNPVFKVGMAFSDVNEFRAALNSYSVRNRVKINKIRNEIKRVNACCEEGCSWMIKASKNSTTGAFVVWAYEGNHTCEGVWKLKTLTAPFLTQKFLDEFRDNMKMDLKTFANKVQREYNMCPDRWKLGRARKEALTIIHGDEAAQFNQLWDYGHELRRSNPGSKFFITCNKVKVGDQTEDHLATLYWSYDALKRGFLRGCRPLICVDGCHIKTRYKGQLLTAVGIDPNDCIYPIAFGLVEVECTSSWEWFLTTLRDDLNITNTSPWTIISDKQKGLIKAVTKVFPDAEHRFCVRHLYQNFQKAGHKGQVLKNNLWAIARSTCVPKWQHNMDKMKAASQKAYGWVEELVPNTWIRAFFSDFPKCDMLLNNHSEVFNSYILQAREMVILSMLETIFYKLMQRVQTKQEEAEKWPGTICPKIKKKLDKYTEWSKACMVKSGGDGLYHVASNEIEMSYVVDLPGRSCDCKRWQLSGIPCHHAIACCRSNRTPPERLVHSCYSIASYREAYAYNLIPLRGRAFWEKTNGVKVYPPLFTKVMGRPKKNRRKAPEENIKNGAKHLTKHGVIMHCSICGNSDHNKRGHDKYVSSVQVEQAGPLQLEDKEFDDPSYIQNIMQQNTNPTLDPMHEQESMVYRLGQEERAHVPPTRTHGSLPQESSFVQSARDSIPAARVRITTASTRGILRGRGRGRTSRAQVPDSGLQETRGRGKGARKRRSDGSTTTSAPVDGHANRDRGRATTRAIYNTGIGSAYYMLFGDGEQQRAAIPNLNAAVSELNASDQNVQEEEMLVTQNAPDQEDV